MIQQMMTYVMTMKVEMIQQMLTTPITEVTTLTTEVMIPIPLMIPTIVMIGIIEEMTAESKVMANTSVTMLMLGMTEM